jgi:hypothetical protein
LKQGQGFFKSREFVNKKLLFAGKPVVFLIDSVLELFYRIVDVLLVDVNGTGCGL